MRALLVLLSSIILGTGQISFNKPVNFPVGTTPYHVQGADLNGDGQLDLAVANRDSGDITILYFEFDKEVGEIYPWKRSYRNGAHPIALLAAELNKDKALDLALVDISDNTLSLMLNQGKGIFSKSHNYTLAYTPYALAASDFEGDGDMDIAVAGVDLNGQGNPSFVTIFDNNGQVGAGFKPAPTFSRTESYPVGLEPRSILCVDLDGNGAIDIATANKGGESISLLFNDGRGKFINRVDYKTNGAAHAIFGADMDGDGDIDLAVSNIGINTVSVFLNQSKGDSRTAVGAGFKPSGEVGAGFKPALPQQYDVRAKFPFSLAGSDLDQDGDIDLVTANLVTDDCSVLLNDGKGRFTWQAVYPVENGPRSIALGDFNGDGYVDIAVTNRFSDNVSLLHQIP